MSDSFSPAGPTVNIAGTTSSGNVLVQATVSAHNIRVVNAGTTPVFLNFGNTNAVAASATTGLPVAGGGTAVFHCPFKYVASIFGTGTGNVYITPGNGGV